MNILRILCYSALVGVIELVCYLSYANPGDLWPIPIFLVLTGLISSALLLQRLMLTRGAREIERVGALFALLAFVLFSTFNYYSGTH